MAPRKPRIDRRVREIVRKMEQITRVSPTTAELFAEWIDRLLAGEPLESVKPEMDELLKLIERTRKGTPGRSRRRN